MILSPPTSDWHPPFFTTKETDKGTGLGLAQVFGFAKQLGERVEISSIVGEATSVRVFLAT